MSKKLFAAFYALSLALAISPLSAVAQTNSSPVSTGFTRSTGGGAEPQIKVKWEMRGGTQGQDDSIASGSQLYPSGDYQVDTQVTYCAVATDSDGLSDIFNVYANVYYPEGARFHIENGCGDQVGDEIKLTRMGKPEGLALLCDAIKNGNNNLPVWATGFNYSEVCAQDGELQKETAAVYCGTRPLSYEDPSGVYMVKVHAADIAGNDSVQLVNDMTYLALTAFDVDFSSVNYGNVRLNTHKIKNGNLTFSNGDGLPTVRNTGNTRMTLGVKQDDMGLGSTDGQWNVQWDGRVGSDAAWSYYDPNVREELENTLELSEDDEVDFSILVRKFPIGTGENGIYSGTMELDATPEDHLRCE